MVKVFALFGTLDSVPLRQMASAWGVAVALDATVIRGIVVPATMKLLGDWNWWLPRKLDWLPRGRTRPDGSHTPPRWPPRGGPSAP
jgi:putative drug exporter of the RND superfamily